jgi:D-sedoheptulose 7-phosphate isomerase
MSFERYIQDLNGILSKIERGQLDGFIDLLLKAYREGKSIYVIGNGGSAANASHFAQDLAKGCRGALDSDVRFKAASLTDNIPFITALANDDGYQYVFEQQLRTFAKTGDILVAISGSGNSPNVLMAVDWANRNDLVTVGVTGFDGGRLKASAGHQLHVPLNDMCTAESIHSILFHYVVLELQKRLNLSCQA